MTKFDSKKFLEALQGMDFSSAPPPQTASAGNFAQYMAARSFGMPAQSKNLGLAAQAEQDHRGFLSKAFGWLGSLGTMTENVFMDASDPKQSFTESLGNAGKDVGAGLVAALQPAIDLGPIPTPWEDSVSKFIYENNTTRNGQAVSGASILGNLGVDNPVAKYGGGFAIDVLTDPLTYLGVGLANPNKWKSAEKAIEAISSGKKTETAAAAIQAGKNAAEQSVGLAKPQFETATSYINKTLGVPEKAGEVRIPGIGKETPDVSGAVAQILGKTSKEFKKDIKVKGSPTEAPLWIKPSKDFKTPVPDYIEDPKAFNELMFHQMRKNTGKVLNTKGINPFVVNEAAQAALAGTISRTVAPVAQAVGHSSVIAQREAQKLASNLGKPIGKSGARRLPELNPANQANLYNRMYEATAALPEISSKFKGLRDSPAAKIWRRQESVKMLRSAEDSLITTRGLRGQHWNGTGLRLSDVIAEVGSKSLDEYIPRILNAFKTRDLSKLNDPEVKKLIETAIGRRVATTGGVAKTLYTDFASRYQVMENTMSPLNFDRWRRGEIQAEKARAMMMGLTAKEANYFAELVRQHTGIQDVALMEPFHVVEIVGSRKAKAMLAGKVDDKAIRQVTKSITIAIGSKPGLISRDLLQNKVKEWMGANLTTWYGRGDMVPLMRTEMSLAVVHALGRKKWFSGIVQGHSPAEIETAFFRAQKPASAIEGEVFTPKVEELARKFKDYFENILGSSSTIAKLEDVEGTVAAKSQMIMDDLNRQLKAIGNPFQFTKGKDGNWVNSWENIAPKLLKQNPALLMYNLDLSVQRTLAEYNLVDMFMTEFGKVPGEAGFDALTHTHQMAHHRIPNEVLFDREVRDSFTRMIRDIEKGPWRPSNKQTQMMTNGLRRWKSMVTIYYPSHHIRNLMGDTWLMWVAGHNDPRVFVKAQRIIGSQRHRYAEAIGNPELDVLTKFTNPKTIGWAQTEGRALITRKYGSNISADEFMGEAMSRGLLVDYSRIEDLVGNTVDSTSKSLLTKPLGGKAHDAFTKVSEIREHYVRLAHFVSYAEKHMGRELGAKLAKETSPVKRSELMKKMFDDAAIEIRKYHPDGTDMSFFEQKYLRNIIPFYSWTRKAIPLTIEAMALRPAKVLSYPRGMYAVQGSLGINAPGGPSDPFPDDQLFPDFMRGPGTGPIGDPESDNPFARWFGKLGRNQITPFGQERGYTVVDPGRGGLPTGMIGSMLGMGSGSDILKGAKDQVTPFVSLPAQLWGNQTNTGAPISGPGGDGLMSYLAGQVPQIAPVQRVFGFGKSPQQGTETGVNYEALINMLTGLGLTGTGKYTKAAQYDAKQRGKG